MFLRQMRKADLGESIQSFATKAFWLIFDTSPHERANQQPAGGQRQS